MTDIVQMTAAEWPARWEARWIWDRLPADASRLAPAPVEEDGFVLLRREVSLDVVPSRVTVRVVSDGRHQLRVNGALVLRGPIRSHPGSIYWDEVDISAHLRPGPNVLALLVRHYGSPVPWWAPAPAYARLGRGGAAVECREVSSLSSTSAWQAWRGAWTSRPAILFGPPGEDLDARLLPVGWDSPSAVLDWPGAVELPGEPWSEIPAQVPATPFSMLLPNPLPPPVPTVRPAHLIGQGTARGDLPRGRWEWAPGDPAYTAAGDFEVVEAHGGLPAGIAAGGCMVFDVGRQVLGRPSLELEATAGTRVVLRAAERIRDGLPDDAERRWFHAISCREGAQSLMPFEAIGFRYLSVSADQAVRVLEAGVEESLYPYRADGSFACDDPELDRLWAAGVRTLQLCSTDAFIDCPSREQRTWVSDVYLHSLVTYVTSSDTRLVAHTLRLAAQGRRADGLLPMVAAGDFALDPVTIPSGSLHWIRALARAYEYMGDIDLVTELLPTAAGILDWFWLYVRGGVLQPTPGWFFVDWLPLAGTSPSATVNLLLLLALDDHQRLCAAVGDAPGAERSRRRAEEMRAGFAAFTDERGQLVDEDGVRSQHSIALAILAGLAGDGGAMLQDAVSPEVARYPQALDESAQLWGLSQDFDRDRHVLATQPFFAHFLHQAMAATGRVDLVIESIRRWRQFLDAGDDTFWEHWADQGEKRSHVHGWAATPTFDLSTHVLGVRPAAPGYARVEVRPHLGRLGRATGRVPTPRGLVEVEYEAREGDLKGCVTLPEGTTGSMVLAGVARELRPGANSV